MIELPSKASWSVGYYVRFSTKQDAFGFQKKVMKNKKDWFKRNFIGLCEACSLEFSSPHISYVLLCMVILQC